MMHLWIGPVRRRMDQFVALVASLNAQGRVGPRCPKPFGPGEQLWKRTLRISRRQPDACPSPELWIHRRDRHRNGRPFLAFLDGNRLLGALINGFQDKRSLRFRWLLDQHHEQIIVVQLENFGRNAHANRVALTTIHIDDDTHVVSPLDRYPGMSLLGASRTLAPQARS